MDRRRQIGDAALKAFCEAGFRLTQVADIARLAGTSPGTLYLYSPSKEGLFLMALERALGEDPQDVAYNADTMLEQVRTKITSRNTLPILTASVEEGSDDLPALDAVLNEVWNSIASLTPTIVLIEKCAKDWPELAAMFYDTIRPILLRMLATYLRKGSEKGLLRKPPDEQLAARLIVETMAWFAIHRHGDYDGRNYDSSVVKATTIDALFHAYCMPTERGERP